MEGEINRKPFLVRLFKGDVPLGTTFWVYGVLVNFLLNAIAFVYPMMVDRPSALFMNIFSVVAIFYLFFIWIAIARSAFKYQGKRIWTVLAVMVVVLGVINLIYSMVQGYRESQQVVNEWSDINKKLPKMLNKEVQLDSIELGGSDLFFNLTLVNKTKAMLDLEKFNADTKGRLVADVCKRPQTRKFLDDNFNLIFIYQDKDGEPLDKFFITNLDCNEKEE